MPSYETYETHTVKSNTIYYKVDARAKQRGRHVFVHTVRQGPPQRGAGLFEWIPPVEYFPQKVVLDERRSDVLLSGGFTHP